MPAANCPLKATVKRRKGTQWQFEVCNKRDGERAREWDVVVCPQILNRMPESKRGPRTHTRVYHVSQALLSDTTAAAAAAAVVISSPQLHQLPPSVWKDRERFHHACDESREERSPSHPLCTFTPPLYSCVCSCDSLSLPTCV